MPWIESHTNISRHPKTLRLARQLGVIVAQAVGHLHMLWHWTLEFAEDGDLSRFEAAEIATAAGWPGDPEAFVAALVECGFLDEDEDRLLVHDWDDYAGRLLADRERKRQARKRDAGRSAERPGTDHGTDADVQQSVRGTSADSPRTVHGTSAERPRTVRATVPNHTVPNRTVPYPTEGDYSCATDGADAPPPHERTQDQPPTRPATNTRRDELFEAVIESCYGRPYAEVQLTRAERGRVNAAVKQLREIGATPDDVRRKAALYAVRWPHVDLTPTALVANWHKLDHPPARASPAANGRRSNLDVALETLARIREAERDTGTDGAVTRDDRGLLA